MLLQRSAIIQILLASISLAQHYDSDYRSDESEDENSRDAGAPDYSKYYSSDASAPLTQSNGFVSPAEFSNFFGPSYFSASNKQEVKSKENVGFVTPHEHQSGFTDFKSRNPFGNFDFFDQAQKQESELKPGPSYVSHKIIPPAKTSSKYGSELSDLNKDYQYNPYKTLTKETNENENEKEDAKEETITPKYDYNYPPYKPQKQAIIDPKYLPQYTPKNPQNLTPYQKYSFQPITANSDFKSYNPSAFNNYNKYTTTLPNNDFSPSEYKAKLYKNCKKIQKEVRNGKSKPDSMDCYVCKDEKTGGNYEQCSYGSESSPKNYYIESSSKYSQPSQLDNYRYKRYTVEDDKDPYEYLKSQSEKYYSKPTDFESHYQKPEYDEYRFGPEYFQEDEEKSTSEKTSEKLVKNGENCNKVYKDGMVCMQCNDKKTGGNYEQCSYSSKPAEKKYAYVKERKYDSDDDDETEEETEGSEEKPVNYGEKRKRERGHRVNEEVERVKPVNTNREKPSHYSIPKHFENIRSQKNDEEDDDEESDKYYQKYSPEESKKNERKEKPETYGYYGDEGKKDVEEVLAEFAKKDRSQCEKAEKNGMTCYLCTDKKGIKHEECMFVSESKPQSSYAAYHAKQKTKEPQNEESKVKSTEVPVPKSKRVYKKATSIEPHSSENVKVTTGTVQQFDSKPKATRTYRRTKNIPKLDTATSETQYQEKKKEVQVDKTERQEQFADETKPVYSKKLGFSLPKYMLDKSDGELIYDEFVNSKS